MDAGPVVVVLVPAHAGSVTRQLDEHARIDQDQVGTQDSFHRVEQARMAADLQPKHFLGVRLAVVLIPVEKTRTQAHVQRMPHGGDFVRPENIGEKAIAFGGKAPGVGIQHDKPLAICGRARESAQASLKSRKLGRRSPPAPWPDHPRPAPRRKCGLFPNSVGR